VFFTFIARFQSVSGRPRPIRVLEHLQGAVSKYGRLDIAFNNAGVAPKTMGTAIADVSLAEWNRILSINLNGVFFGLKYQVSTESKLFPTDVVHIRVVILQR
jgi:NAD(P)-dependent dehydrogenase (short-subunit alcohol dehydrogenase family)